MANSDASRPRLGHALILTNGMRTRIFRITEGMVYTDATPLHPIPLEHVVRAPGEPDTWILTGVRSIDVTLMLEAGDSVRIRDGGPAVYTIVGTRSPDDLYQIQLGNNAASVQWKKGSELELVVKAKTSDGEPGFVPTRSIMD